MLIFSLLSQLTPVFRLGRKNGNIQRALALNIKDKV